MKITKESLGNQLKIKIHFSHQIDNHEEYRIVTLCGIAGYFVEKDKLSLKIKHNSLFVGDIEIVHINILDNDIDIMIYLDLLKPFVKKVNEMMVWVGCQTFLKVYFNLYHHDGYKDIFEFYQMIS